MNQIDVGTRGTHAQWDAPPGDLTDAPAPDAAVKSPSWSAKTYEKASAAADVAKARARSAQYAVERSAAAVERAKGEGSRAALASAKATQDAALMELFGMIDAIDALNRKLDREVAKAEQLFVESGLKSQKDGPAYDYAEIVNAALEGRAPRRLDSELHSLDDVRRLRDARAAAAREAAQPKPVAEEPEPLEPPLSLEERQIVRAIVNYRPAEVAELVGEIRAVELVNMPALSRARLLPLAAKYPSILEQLEPEHEPELVAGRKWDTF